MVLHFDTIPLHQYSDEELIYIIQSTADNRYFGELYRRYFARVRDYCRKIVADSDTAADIAQNSFIRAFEKIDGLRVPQTWVAWIFRISRNECLHHLKSQQRKRTESIDTFHQIADSESNPEVHIQLDNREKAQLRAIEQLPSTYRDILLIKYRDGKSIEDMQIAYGIGESALKMRLLRARQQAVRLAATM